MLRKDIYRPFRPSRLCEPITLRRGGDARYYDYEVRIHTLLALGIHLFFFHPRRYEPTLNGVVLAHSDVHFLNPVAQLQADSPFAICHVGFDALIWKPTRGMKLSASIHRAFILTPSYHNSSTGEGEEHALCPRTDKWY